MALILPLALKFASPVFPPLNISGTVYDVIIDESDNNYIFGDFTTVQGNTRFGAAELSYKNALHPTLGIRDLNQTVSYATASGYDSGIGERVFYYAPNTLNKIRDSSYTVLATGTQTFNGLVQDILTDYDNSGVFVRGSFTEVGSTSRNTIAKFSSSLTLDTVWHCNPGNGTGVMDMKLSKTIADRMYLSGNFTTIKGQSSRKTLVRVNRSNAVIDTLFNFVLGTPSSGYVSHFDVASDETLVVSGQYFGQYFLNKLSSAGAVLADYTSTILSVYDSVDGRDSFFALDLTPYYVHITSTGKILVSVYAGTYRGSPISPIVFLIRLTSGGSLDTTFNSTGYMLVANTSTGPGVIQRIHSIGVASTGRMTVGGAFTSINGIPKTNYCVMEDNGNILY